MSETPVAYRTTSLFTPGQERVIVNTELDTVRAQLQDLECQLISLLVTVQRAQGKEPTVLTRAERRRR